MQSCKDVTEVSGHGATQDPSTPPALHIAELITRSLRANFDMWSEEGRARNGFARRLELVPNRLQGAFLTMKSVANCSNCE